jgi:hypothetical protein
MMMLGIITNVADSLKLECGRTEAFSWPGVDPQSEAGGKIFLSVLQSLELEGYVYVDRDLPQPKDEEQAKVLQRMKAYSSETSDRQARDRHILTVWYRESDELHLVLCTASEMKPPKEEG